MDPKTYRIAMVDDDAEDVFAIRKGLQSARLPIDFVELSSASMLFDYLAAKSSCFPDLLLLDINMPRMNGFEVLERLKDTVEWRDIPVVILSTSSLKADRDKSLQLGAEAFVTKFSSMKSMGAWVTKLETLLEKTSN